ncbi:phage tail assembly chaperone [Pontixanthobacter sp.]|uniref:phage tail assembly chaperone n=1 Tax=Pontixanthobacter sp. TaxID=2792078 RepID=UPI003C7CA011
MTGTFGEAALQLASLSARALGWRPQEFWSATPVELAAALGTPLRSADTLTRHDLNILLEQDGNGR